MSSDPFHTPHYETVGNATHNVTLVFYQAPNHAQTIDPVPDHDAAWWVTALLLPCLLFVLGVCCFFAWAKPEKTLYVLGVFHRECVEKQILRPFRAWRGWKQPEEVLAEKIARAYVHWLSQKIVAEWEARSDSCVSTEEIRDLERGPLVPNPGFSGAFSSSEEVGAKNFSAEDLSSSEEVGDLFRAVDDAVVAGEGVGPLRLEREVVEGVGSSSSGTGTSSVSSDHVRCVGTPDGRVDVETVGGILAIEDRTAGPPDHGHERTSGGHQAEGSSRVRTEKRSNNIYGEQWMIDDPTVPSLKPLQRSSSLPKKKAKRGFFRLPKAATRYYQDGIALSDENWQQYDDFAVFGKEKDDAKWLAVEEEKRKKKYVPGILFPPHFAYVPHHASGFRQCPICGELWGVRVMQTGIMGAKFTNAGVVAPVLGDDIRRFSLRKLKLRQSLSSCALFFVRARNMDGATVFFIVVCQYHVIHPRRFSGDRFFEGDLEILIPVPQFGLDLADSVIVEQGFGWGYVALVCCGHTPFASLDMCWPSVFHRDRHRSSSGVTIFCPPYEGPDERILNLRSTMIRQGIFS